MDGNAERELIERAQWGDQSAYQELFKIYRPRIFRLLNYILKDSADADDVAQDVFLKLYGSLGSFRHQSAFFTWLYKIATNAARARLAATSRDTNVLAGSDSEDLERSYSSETDQPENMHARSELARMLDLAIMSLPPALREAFLLRELDGLSYAEIAELNDCPVGTVRSRISRAKSYLAEYIAEHEPESWDIAPYLPIHHASRSRSTRH